MPCPSLGHLNVAKRRIEFCAANFDNARSCGIHGYIVGIIGLHRDPIELRILLATLTDKLAVHRGLHVVVEVIDRPRKRSRIDAAAGRLEVYNHAAERPIGHSFDLNTVDFAE